MSKHKAPSQAGKRGPSTQAMLTHGITAAAFLVLGLALGAGASAGFDVPSDAVLPTLAASAAAPFASPTPQRATIDASDDPAIGNESAAVTVVMFSDFACTFCGYFGRTTWNSLLERYSERVRFVYRDLPITNPMSLAAAQAAECADDQGAFWAYHDRLFADQALLTEDHLLTIAAALELDEKRFSDCVADNTHREEILADYAEGQALGLSGAPVFFINGRRIEGAQPLSELSAILDDEIAAVGG